MTGEAPERFWDIADQMVDEAQIVIDRPKGARHPRFPDIIYPMDYGFLEGTISVADGEGVDVWQGSQGTRVTAILTSIDLTKRDTEIKLLLGCTEDEISLVYRFHNSYASMASALLRRPAKGS